MKKIIKLEKEYSYKEIENVLNQYPDYKLPTIDELKSMKKLEKLDYMSSESSYKDMIDYVGFNIIGTDKVLVREHRSIDFNYPLSIILVKK